MNESEILYDVLIFLLAAVVVVPLLRRLRASPVLGYLAAGIIIGPFGLAIIRDSQNALTLAEFGVVFLLFMIGLELSVERLRSLRRYIFGLGLLQVIITGSIIGGIAWALGATKEAAAIIGSGLALSSTAFVLQLLKEKGELTSRFGQVSFAILLLQDIAVVPFLILVALLGEGDGSFLGAIGIAALKAGVVLALVIGFGRLLLRPIYRLIAKTGSSELFIATTLLTVLGTGWLVSLGGLSIALGAFLAGLLLAETEYRHQVEADIRPFRGILLGLFFMTVGMSMDFALIQANLWQIGLLVGALLIGKTIITALLCRSFGLTASISVKVGMLLSQGGEFGFIIFAAASALGLLELEITQVLLATVALTMVLTPGMALAGNYFSQVLLVRDKKFVAGLQEKGTDLKDHVIIAGFGRVGQTVARILEAEGAPYIGVDLDPDRVLKCRKDGMNVFFGDASQIEILKTVGAKSARAAAITIDLPDQANKIISALHEYAPRLQLFVRARDLKHSRQLKNEGVAAAVPATIEASLQLGGMVLKAAGAPPKKVAKILQEFRKADYAKLEKMIIVQPDIGDD